MFKNSSFSQFNRKKEQSNHKKSNKKLIKLNLQAATESSKQKKNYQRYSQEAPIRSYKTSKDNNKDKQPLLKANDDYNDDDKDTGLLTKQVDGWGRRRRTMEKDSQQRTTTGITTTTIDDHNNTTLIQTKFGRKSLEPHVKRVYNRNRKIFKTGTTTTRKNQPIIRKNNCNINLVNCNHQIFTTNAPTSSTSTTTTTKTTRTSTQRKGKVFRKVIDLSKYRYIKQNL